MTKSKSKFASLPEQHRNLILELCSSRPYDQVVDLLAKPDSEGGFGMATSRSALCRFFTTTFAEPSIKVLSQWAAAANIHHELGTNIFLGAIRASVQARVLEMLKNGKALSDMEKDFKLLKTAESLYLADARFRANDPNGARPAYQALVDQSVNAPDFDFTPIGELPIQNPTLLQLSQFDQDVIRAREEQKLSANPPTQFPAGTLHTDLVVHSTSEQAKSPVIPHIPPNSTSVSLHANQTAKTASVPFVRSIPKIGRNDTCPCGSGLKYKKCCERTGANH